MRKVIWFFLISFPEFAQAQNNRINGFTVKQNSGFKAISDVSVFSNGANVTRSLSDGSFSFIFQNVTAGDYISINAQKEGWEVVNEKDLLTVVPSDYRSRPLRIVLCKSGTINENRIRYYNISVKYISKRFEEEIEKVKKENINWKDRVEKIMMDKELLLKQAEELARRYSRVNFDDVSKAEKEAFNLYQEGRIKEAINLLENVDSEVLIRQAKEARERWNINRDSILSEQERIKAIFQADSTLKNKQK